MSNVALFEYASPSRIQSSENKCAISLAPIKECTSVLWHPFTNEGKKKWYHFFYDNRPQPCPGHYFEEDFLRYWLKDRQIRCPTCAHKATLPPLLPLHKRLFLSIIQKIGTTTTRLICKAPQSLQRKFSCSEHYSLFNYMRLFANAMSWINLEEDKNPFSEIFFPTATFLMGATGAVIVASQVCPFLFAGQIWGGYFLLPYVYTAALSTLTYKNPNHTTKQRIIKHLQSSTLVQKMERRLGYIITMNGIGAGAFLFLTPLVGLVNAIAIGTLAGHSLTICMPSL